MKTFIQFLIILTLTELLFANGKKHIANEVKEVVMIKTEQSIIIDGILNEEFWKTSTGLSGFTQRDPIENTAPTEETVVFLTYDDEALYIGARLYDSSPDSIVARLARRDVSTNSDILFVCLDPFFDRRSGYYFGISAAGTLYDGILYNNDWDDASWDGIWEGKVNIDKEGWTVEMKVPFSQMRFNKNKNNIWGINIRRDIARKNERDFLVYFPKTESGFVSHFIELKGMDNINPPGTLEVLPYVTSRAEYKNPDSNDPFNKKAEYEPGMGIDFKTGIGTNLTLNLSLNPDFGQVEIDPAVINLSDVETFFDEKRPFFIEGSATFNFGMGGARNFWGFNWPGPSFFYSRRIGRKPQGSLPDDVNFSEYPDGTNILGAAKLTGKIGENWSVGVIQALTQREFARIEKNDIKSELEVEPLTYYGIFRAQKEINEGKQGIGFLSTITSRSFKDNRLRNELNQNAFSGGIDGWTFLDSSRTWVLSGWAGLTHLTGTTDRMIALQTNSQHYFQRPDAKNVSIDSNATSLTGYAGRLIINKQKGNFFFNSGFGVISPEFDPNDLGFLSRSNIINMHTGAGYYWNLTDYFRYLEVGGALFRNYDFDGNITWEGIFHFGYVELLNYYNINWNLAYNPATINDRRTRGGPLTLNEPGYQVNFYINSDNRKDVVVSVGAFTYQTKNSMEWNTSFDVEFRPASNISFSFGPFYNKNIDDAQWINVDPVNDALAVSTYGKRYLFAHLDQNTFGANIRLNWTFTPELSLQFYAQPLISSGNYSGFKELRKAGSYDFLVYGKEGSTFDDQNFIADPDGNGPASSIDFDNPDFNTKTLRGNAVLRWEYIPGSVLYFVWTQSRYDEEETGNFQFKNSMKRILNTRPDNIFMIKLTYWFNM